MLLAEDRKRLARFAYECVNDDLRPVADAIAHALGTIDAKDEEIAFLRSSLDGSEGLRKSLYALEEAVVQRGAMIAFLVEACESALEVLLYKGRSAASGSYVSAGEWTAATESTVAKLEASLAKARDGR